MVPLPWLRAAVTSVALCFSFCNLVFAQVGARQPASPSYRGRDACPERCSILGPDPFDWTVYRNLDQLRSCSETVFYQFALHDAVDDPETLHRIYACTSYGPDWANLPNATADEVAPAQTARNASYQIGWWSDENTSRLADADIRTLSKQMDQYLTSGYGPTDRGAFLFAQSGRASLGLYIGKGLQNEGTSSFALKALHDNIRLLNVTGGSVAMQLCSPGNDGDHIFGLIATSNATFTPIQDALKSWSNAQCLSFSNNSLQTITGPAFLLTPSLNVTALNGTNATIPVMNGTTARNLFGRTSAKLSPRANCRSIQVVAGDGCASLATRCGIAGADITKYNTASNFCSTLQPFQHICCSAGTLPDFTPKPNADGSCATAKVNSGDTCSAIAANNSLTVDKLISFNKNTWAFNGCSNIWVGTIICISAGTPPMPATIAGTVCGPQVVNTTRPAAGVDIASLNPCPLNACCDVWGQCGTTAEFCTNTSTGAPGTAAPGTNGCISNCGTQIVRSAAPAVFRKIAYFEGYNLNRKCLYQDARQLDPSKYTHIHFGFGTITQDYKVNTGDLLTGYEFRNFKHVQGPKKILSFGGWDFSTGASTYKIFRQGVQAANRLTLATNIANFIIANNLDGVDIDWEYPAAPDIPNIPADDPKNGDNYLAFLVILKNLLPGKSVSIAAPASYWYLKGFPIAKMSKIVDYIIYMTYDLHGQWDANNKWSQPGCESGMCLRSGVNLTETINALVMITKAGVPSNQVVVGVTSYGRSFGMADGNCHTENCLYTGSALASTAQKGPCTDTGGYISDAEIKDIIASGKNINQNYIDAKSNTNILVYNGNQWVGWMSPQIKASRKTTYQNLNMGGSTDWASDLEDYTPSPSVSRTWSEFILACKAGTDPYVEGPRTGNWTTIDCSAAGVQNSRLTPKQHWDQVDAADAWKNLVDTWNSVDKARGMSFTASVRKNLDGPTGAECGTLAAYNNCEATNTCRDFGVPAAWMIWDSLVRVHEVYATMYQGITVAAAGSINPALQDFENKFAPVPEPPDNTWLQILLDLVGLGLAMGTGSYITKYVAKLPYFIARAGSADMAKDTSFAFIASGVSVAKDLVAAKGTSDVWTAGKQAVFSNYMGQVLVAWGNSTEHALTTLFNGDPGSLSTLTTLISDGKWVDGDLGNGLLQQVPFANNTISDVAAGVTRAFFGFAIPAIWGVSGTYSFVLDSGYPCGTIDPMGQYVNTDTQHATWGCYQDKLYYLVAPMGNSEDCFDGGCLSNTFSAPPGLDSLDGKNFGGIRVQDLIQGAVRTYIANGNKNGAPVPDPMSSGTFDDLVNQDISTPGYVRLPVCSPGIAFRAWDRTGGPDLSDPNYPCSVPTGINDCGDSSFIDQTSGGSPSVADCLQLAANLQNAPTPGEWEVENAIGNQHELVSAGGCKFGVQGIGKNGNIDFHVGSQDIIDIINESVKRFGDSGRVGAKGSMSCQGTVKGQDVDWGLY